MNCPVLFLNSISTLLIISYLSFVLYAKFVRVTFLAFFEICRTFGQTKTK